VNGYLGSWWQSGDKASGRVHWLRTRHSRLRNWRGRRSACIGV